METKKKIYLADNLFVLNVDLLKNNFDIVEDIDSADLIIAQSTVSHLNQPRSKIIYINVEPPLVFERIDNLNRLDEFFLSVTFNADESKKNQMRFTEKDEDCIYYPYNYRDNCDINKNEHTLSERSVFYAGRVYLEECKPSFGHSIIPLRRKLWASLMNEFQKSDFFIREINSRIIPGDGIDWRRDKVNYISNSECDFVLALENVRLKNYVSEKMWDGLISNRVTLYLGEPEISKYLPEDVIVDLSKFYNQEEETFDYDSLVRFLKEITPDQYNDRLRKAREFVESCEGKYEVLRDRLTNRIVNYINEQK